MLARTRTAVPAAGAAILAAGVQRDDRPATCRIAKRGGERIRQRRGVDAQIATVAPARGAAQLGDGLPPIDVDVKSKGM
jgi:hypothetical protein